MRRSVFHVVATSLTLATYSITNAQILEAGSAAQILAQEQHKVGVEIFTSPNYRPRPLRHIVLFKYNDSVTPAQRAEVKQRFLALGAKALRQGRPYIVSIETGSQISGEGVDRGLDQAFIVTFRSEGDRNYYVGSPIVTDAAYYDPAHAAFKRFVASHISEAVVFDYQIDEAYQGK